MASGREGSIGDHIRILMYCSPFEIQAWASKGVSRLLLVTDSGHSLVLLHKRLLTHGSVCLCKYHPWHVSHYTSVELSSGDRLSERPKTLPVWPCREFADPACQVFPHLVMASFEKMLFTLVLSWRWAWAEVTGKAAHAVFSHFPPLCPSFPCARTWSHVSTRSLSFAWIFWGATHRGDMPSE